MKTALDIHDFIYIYIMDDKYDDGCQKMCDGVMLLW